MNNKLKQITFLKDCENSFFETLEAHAQHQFYKKGEMLFIHEEQAERFYFIKSGWIKLFRETLDGTQAVVDVLPAGHVFGETAIFEGDVYPYSAEAVEPAEVISLPLSDLKTEIEHNNKLALSLLNSMAQRCRQQDKEIEHRCLQSASQRIGCFILRLADQTHAGPLTIHLPYDKTLVASRLGMQPETFSRALAKLREQTGIRVKGSMIEMDSLEKLVDHCCSACSSEFPCKDLQAAE